MIAKGTRIALEVVAGVLAVVVLLVVVALWRLSTAPVQLDFITPRIEAALADPQRGLLVRIGATELTWPDRRRSIGFRIRDVRIRNREGVNVAALPDVMIRLSLRALVQGVIAPTVVEVIGARLSLVREPNGYFNFDHAGAGTEASPGDADFSQVLPSVVEQLMSKPVVERPLSFLNTFRIVNGRVSINDQKLRRVWEIPLADIELRRDSAGLAGDVALTIDLGESQAKMSGGFLYDRGTDRINLSGGFTGLRTEALISLMPRLEALDGLAISLEGSLSASLGLDGAMDSLRFEVTGVGGTLELPGILAGPLQLREAKLLGRVNGPERRIDLETAVVRLGSAEKSGPRISGTATLTAAADGFGGDLSVEAEVTASGLSMQELDRYWPVPLEAGRRWVLRNIPHGTVDEAVVRTVLRIPDGRTDGIELRRLDGALRYHDLEVHYWRPMPPVIAISGTAVFDRHGFTFTPRGGRLLDLNVVSGAIKITGLDIAKETVEIDLDLSGPLRTSLEILDHDRLRLIRKLGIDPVGTAGQMAGNLKFNLPIYVETTLDNLGVSAAMGLEGAVVRGILLGQDVTEGRLALTVDKAAMEVRGPLRFAGVPMEIVWNEAFTEETPLRSQIEARIPRIGAVGRAALGLNLAPYLEGPVSADVTFASDRSGRGTLRAKVDLETASLALSPLIWDKPAGVGGTADVSLGLVEHRLLEITRFDVSAGTLRARGVGRFDVTGQEIASLALDDLVFDDTRLTEVTVDWLGDGTAVRVGGGVLDAVPFLGGGESEDATPESRQATEDQVETDPDRSVGSAAESERLIGASNALPAPKTKRVMEPRPATEPQAFTPFALTAPRLDSVAFGPDRFLESVRLELRRGRGGWQRILVKALVPRVFWSPERSSTDAGQQGHRAREGPGEGASEDGNAAREARTPSPPPEPIEPWLAIDFRPIAGGRYGFSAQANDVGAALRALDQLETIHGGQLVIEGQSDGPLPGSTLEGRIEARDYIVVDAPGLARLLTLASPTGINDLIRGEGIRFDRLVGEFTLLDGLMETDLLRAYGSSLGLTAEGKIDFDRSLTDLRGTVVPAYTLNRILGGIPLLGPLLTGGEGGGLLAVTYHMTGELGDPDVSVNPLSALFPGFLRGLFSGDGASQQGEEPRAFPERIER